MGWSLLRLSAKILAHLRILACATRHYAAVRYLRTDALTVSRSVMHQRYYQLDDIKQVDHAEQKQA